MIVLKGTTPFIDWSGQTTAMIDGDPLSALSMSSTWETAERLARASWLMTNVPPNHKSSNFVGLVLSR